MDTAFFQLPDIPHPWNLLHGWSDEESIAMHGIKKREISSDCFYYLELLTELSNKYGNHYLFDKLPKSIFKLESEDKNISKDFTAVQNKFSE